MIHYVKKSSGNREPFSIEKFRSSLKRVDAPPKLIDQIISEVLDRSDLDTTYKIYAYAYNRLKGVDRPVAARYSLKSALYDLGPEGFFFERFVAEIFKALGYTIELDRSIPGKCVEHEIDISVEKDDERCMVECKFHNRRGLKTDVKVALYVKARFLDLSQVGPSASSRVVFNGVWLVTNTQFTSQAIQYGLCSGIRLLGWAYPEEENIAYYIEKLGLHPITSLTCLSKAQKHQLLEKNILLCRDLLGKPTIMDLLGFTLLKQQRIKDECSALCSGEPPSQ